MELSGTILSETIQAWMKVLVETHERFVRLHDGDAGIQAAHLCDIVFTDDPTSIACLRTDSPKTDLLRDLVAD